MAAVRMTTVLIRAHKQAGVLQITQELRQYADEQQSKDDASASSDSSAAS